MDTASLIVFMVVIIFFIAVMIFARKYLDHDTYAMVRAKILALEVWAEFNITGKKCGDERMDKVEELVRDNFSPKELTFLEAKGGIRDFAESVLPVARKLFLMLFKKAVR